MMMKRAQLQSPVDIPYKIYLYPRNLRTQLLIQLTCGIGPIALFVQRTERRGGGAADKKGSNGGTL